MYILYCINPSLLLIIIFYAALDLNLTIFLNFFEKLVLKCGKHLNHLLFPKLFLTNNLQLNQS